jgi:hypothetical protein
MRQPTPGERLAVEIPPDACRRVLARLAHMRVKGEVGSVAELKLDKKGQIYVEVHEVYSWGRDTRTGGV